MDRRVIIGDVAAFREVAPDKAQALKPLEEAAEVYAAWQAWEKAGEDEGAAAYCALMDECADVIQATCNLLSAMGVTNFRHYMERCERRNRDRGRM